MHSDQGFNYARLAPRYEEKYFSDVTHQRECKRHILKYDYVFLEGSPS